MRLSLTIVVANQIAAVASLAGTVNRNGFQTVQPPPGTHRALDEEPNPFVCPEGVKTAEEDWKVAGPNLGGWLVLEPWITPSLFYQFLSEAYDHVSWDDKWGKDAPKHTGMDSYTFCDALGPVEGNIQMRRHWKTWVREEEIAGIAATGATHVRIPIGDWMYKPYGPYIGCMDGAVDELERVLALCSKYGIKALLDLHAVRFSQNGFDNSGQALDVSWGSEDQLVGFEMTTITTFQHWTTRAAHWMGRFDHKTNSYPVINNTNIDFTLEVIDEIIKAHKGNPAVWGVEPVNEPWQFTPLFELKMYYWKAYHSVRKSAPHWRFVMHDSFRGYPAAWWDFMKGCPMKALDSHVYQAWNRPGLLGAYHAQACGFKGGVRVMEDLVDMPLIVGEWSLATDNCAMWLNGFNDNLPGFPKVTCGMYPCAEPYMGKDQPGAPPDPELPLQGPYGTGVSGPQFGKCPVGFTWGEEEDSAMTALTAKLLSSFTSGHGWFFWNFRTELEPRWSFLDAHSRGWFPKDVSAFGAADALEACPPQPTSAAVTASPVSTVSAVVQPAAAVSPTGGAAAAATAKSSSTSEVGLKGEATEGFAAGAMFVLLFGGLAAFAVVHARSTGAWRAAFTEKLVPTTEDEAYRSVE